MEPALNKSKLVPNEPPAVAGGTRQVPETNVGRDNRHHHHRRRGGVLHVGALH
jgi:hypothetical protein